MSFLASPGTTTNNNSPLRLSSRHDSESCDSYHSHNRRARISRIAQGWSKIYTGRHYGDTRQPDPTLTTLRPFAVLSFGIRKQYLTSYLPGTTLRGLTKECRLRVDWVHAVTVSLARFHSLCQVKDSFLTNDKLQHIILFSRQHLLYNERGLLPGASNRDCARTPVGHSVLAVGARLVGDAATAFDLDEFVLEAGAGWEVDCRGPQWVGGSVLARRQRWRIGGVPAAKLGD